jgi:hypothetical protein
MNFFLSTLICSFLFAACSFGSLLNKSIKKENVDDGSFIERNQLSEPLIHLDNIDGSLEKSGSTVESVGTQSNSPKWTLKANEVNDEDIITNTDINTDIRNRFECPENLKQNLAVGLIAVPGILCVASVAGFIIYALVLGIQHSGI